MNNDVWLCRWLRLKMMMLKKWRGGKLIRAYMSQVMMILITQAEISRWARNKIFYSFIKLFSYGCENFFNVFFSQERRRKAVSCNTSLNSMCNNFLVFPSRVFSSAFPSCVCSSLFVLNQTAINTVRDQKLGWYKLFLRKFQVEGVWEFHGKCHNKRNWRWRFGFVDNLTWED